MSKPIGRTGGEAADQQRLQCEPDLVDTGEVALDRAEAEQGEAGRRDGNLQCCRDTVRQHVRDQRN